MRNNGKQVDFNVKDFKTLKVYQKSLELADIIFKLTKGFPQEEKYRLISQILRSSSSIGANISEGTGQICLKHYLLQYCHGECK